MNKRKLTVVAGTALCALSACLAFAACGGNDHTVKEIKAKDATCTEAGNEHYYMCTDEGCGKYFSDADCKHEIKLEDVVKPALGHDPQKVEAEGATCTTDGHETYYDCSRCELNFADAAGTQILADEDIFIAKYDHDQLREVQKTAPTLQEDGNVYHWHCDRCEKDFTNDNANKEIEDVVIPKLVKETGLTINVATYDNATAEGTAPTGTFALKGTEYPDSDTEGVSIANGKLSVTELIPDSYKFEIEGYYPVYFTVEKGVKEYNLDLYKYFHTHTVDNDNGRVSYDYLDGDLKIHYNNADFNGDTPLVHFADSHITGNNYMAQFTLCYKQPVEYWTSRITIRLGSSNDGNKFIGIMFFPTSDDVHVNDYVVGDPGMGDDTNWNRSPFQIKGTQGTAVNAALLGDGLQVRAMRSGNVLYIRFLINGEWVKVWERNVEGLGTDFAISASCPDSTFTVSDMKYFDYEGMTQTHFGYFYEGTGDNKVIYSSFDANETTLDAMEIKKQNVTVNVEVYDGLRNKIDVPEGLELTLTDSYDRDTIENATIENGVLSATQFLPGRYLVSDISGYYAVDTIYIDVDTTTYTIKLYQIDSRFEISNNDNRVNLSEVEEDLQFTFNNVGLGSNPLASVKLTNEKISGSHYMADLTLQAKNVTGYGWATRIAIYTGTANNDTPVGFTLRLTGENSFDVGTSEWGNTNLEPRNTSSPDATMQRAFMTALRGDGVQIKVSRNGDMHYIRAYLNGEWVLLYQARMTGLEAGLHVLATTNDTDGIVVSHVSHHDTFVSETNEKYAYFVMDGKYYTVDGAETTLVGLDIKKFENLTVNVIVYDKEGNDKQEVSAPTGAFNLYNEVARFTEEGVTIEIGKLSVTELYPGKYIIIIDGYKPVIFTVTEDTTEYNLELYVDDRASNVTVNDTDGMVSISHNNHDGAPFVTLADEAVTGEHYMTEFTVKYAFDNADGGWDWNKRFIIRLGMSPVENKPVGFMFFLKDNISIQGANAYNDRSTDNGGSREPIDNFLAANSADMTAVNAAIRGDGLKVRGVRNGDQLTVYFLIGSEWKPVWEKTVEGLSAYVGVTATSNDSVCTVSGITFGEYVAATDSVEAHLVVGEGATAKVYTLDGVETTLKDLAITE